MERPRSSFQIPSEFLPFRAAGERATESTRPDTLRRGVTGLDAGDGSQLRHPISQASRPLPADVRILRILRLTVQMVWLPVALPGRYARFRVEDTE